MRNLTVAIVLGLALVVGLAATARASASPSVAASTPPPLDLNRASLRELLQLPGVGPGRAIAIMEYRHTHPFRRPSDLLRIKGFGRKLYARLRPLVTVAVASDGPPANPGASASPLGAVAPVEPGGVASGDAPSPPTQGQAATVATSKG